MNKAIVFLDNGTAIPVDELFSDKTPENQTEWELQMEEFAERKRLYFTVVSKGKYYTINLYKVTYISYIEVAT